MKRIVVLDRDKCKKGKVCDYICVSICPRNRAGEACIAKGEKGFPVIDEDLCIGCGLCVKKCPYDALKVVNLPEKLEEEPVHRFGKNGFCLFRLPTPIKGEIVGLLGQNAIGKSTTLKILSGELKPNLGKDASKEQVLDMFSGSHLQSYMERLLDGNVKTAMKPQQVDLLPKVVEGNVKEVLGKIAPEKKVAEMVRKLGIEHILDRDLSKLSGGELQKVAVAAALVKDVDFVYVDEMTSFLDISNRLSTAKLVREQGKDREIVVVEHDLATLDYLADRIHIYYGEAGAYGVVSKPYSVRVGINTFLEGYIREDNVRFREPIKFETRAPETQSWSPLTTFKGIKKKFKGFQMEMEDGEIYEGEVLGVFGSNALGKTTFAKILAGDIKADSGKFEKVKISYKPQYISSDFDGTVLELLSKETNPFSPEFKTELSQPLQLEQLYEKHVSDLSGGELQKVSAAICLAKKAPLYMLDEVSAYLDVESRVAMAKTIRKIVELREASAMVIDHDLVFLDFVSDRALVFKGESGKHGKGMSPMPLQEGFNTFLKDLGITFRNDVETNRPRANKPGSQKDVEQKNKGMYYFV